MTLLKADNVFFKAGEIEILRGVGLSVEPGEMVGLIGPNGAGKSTLLKTLCGIQQPSAGVVRLEGRLLSELGREELARNVAYLQQAARVEWPLSVQRIVELGRIPYQNFWAGQSKEDEAIVERAMEVAEVTAYRNRQVTTLSGGEQTLVMLARIFAGEPKLILADEPVAALDPYHQLHVMELLREHAQGDNGVVVILHDLSLAARFCDRLVLLNHGTLYTEGEPSSVLSNEYLSDVYGVEADLHAHPEGMSVVPVKRVRQGHP